MYLSWPCERSHERLSRGGDDGGRWLGRISLHCLAGAISGTFRIEGISIGGEERSGGGDALRAGGEALSDLEEGRGAMATWDILHLSNDSTGFGTYPDDGRDDLVTIGSVRVRGR
jgi:hypothetical protein